MRIFTIGFTKKSAETFFTTVQQSGAERLVDVRLNNVSQLAGFAKKEDLRFFTQSLCHIDYIHTPYLAPTREMLDDYKKLKGDWPTYERRFLDLMQSRAIESLAPRDLIDGACLLCSEDKPHHCHRRLVAEYLRDHWGGAEIVHLP